MKKINTVLLLAALSTIGCNGFVAAQTDDTTRNTKPAKPSKPSTPNASDASNVPGASTSTVASAATAQSKSQMIAELLTASGYERQLGKLESGMSDAIVGSQPDMGEKRLSSAQLKVVLRGVTAGFNAERISANIKTNLGEKLSAADTQKALEWFNSPLGAKFVQWQKELDETKNHDEAEKGMHKTYDALKPMRREQHQKIEALTRAGEMYASLASYMQQSMIRGTTLAGSAKAADEADDFVDLVRASRAELIDIARKRQTKRSAYALRAATDAEIAEFIAFGDSPAGKQLYLSMAESFEKMMRTGSDLMVREIQSKK